MHLALSELLDLLVDIAAKNPHLISRKKPTQCHQQERMAAIPAATDNATRPSRTNSAVVGKSPKGKASR